MEKDSFGARAILVSNGSRFTIYNLRVLEEAGLTKLDRLPFSIRILLESLLRRADGPRVSEEDVKSLANWKPRAEVRPSIAFQPERVVMHDFTGVPAIVDLAAMRSRASTFGRRSQGDQSPGACRPCG